MSPIKDQKGSVCQQNQEKRKSQRDDLLEISDIIAKKILQQLGSEKIVESVVKELKSETSLKNISDQIAGVKAECHEDERESERRQEQRESPSTQQKVKIEQFEYDQSQDSLLGQYESFNEKSHQPRKQIPTQSKDQQQKLEKDNRMKFETKLEVLCSGNFSCPQCCVGSNQFLKHFLFEQTVSTFYSHNKIPPFSQVSVEHRRQWLCSSKVDNSWQLQAIKVFEWKLSNGLIRISNDKVYQHTFYRKFHSKGCEFQKIMYRPLQKPYIQPVVIEGELQFVLFESYKTQPRDSRQATIYNEISRNRVHFQGPNKDKSIVIDKKAMLSKKYGSEQNPESDETFKIAFQKEMQRVRACTMQDALKKQKMKIKKAQKAQKYQRHEY